MIIKKRDEPLELYQLEALHQRLHRQHRMRERVLGDLIKTKTGLRGEKEVDFRLRFLNEQDFLILQYLRLSDRKGTFQIDNLVLSEKYMLILEVKNWYGTVIFGENGQVTRVGDNGNEERFPNPIPQARLQQHRLQKWLHSHGVSSIPLDFLVVISFPRTIIKSASTTFPIPERVIHTDQLFIEIQKLDNVYQNPIMNMSELLGLAQRLKKAHIRSSTNVLEKYGIHPDELIKGVFCPGCSAVPMIRKNEKWYCRTCQHTSKEAHFPALNDYKLLIGNSISNREARSFLRIESPYVTKRILQMGRFKYIGKTSDRKYVLEIRR